MAEDRFSDQGAPDRKTLADLLSSLRRETPHDQEAVGTAKVLVIEDRVTDREMLANLLRYSKYQVIEAVDGADGLRLAEVEKPDLIITDVLLPVMDGYELVKRLCATPALARTPVIFYTASFSGREALELAMDCGVARIMTKPTDPERILEIVSETLGSKGNKAVPSVSPGFDERHRQLLLNKLIQHVETLNKSDERFRLLAENATDIIFLRRRRPDGGWAWEYVNPASAAILGCSPQELYEAPGLLAGIVHPDHLTDLEKFLSGDIHPDNALQIRFTPRSGRTVWIEFRGTPIFDGKGIMVALEGIGRDITERKELDESLRRREAEMRALIEGMPAAVAVRFDEEGRYLYVSPGIEYTGLPASAYLGRKPSQLSYPPILAGKIESAVKRAVEDGQGSSFYFAFHRPDGIMHRQFRFAPEIEENGAVKTVIGISYDVTELKALEAKLRDAVEAAEKANRAKSEFLANMSHEIRTPMNGIVGMNELALKSGVPPQTREYLLLAKKSAMHLLDIIGDILDISKIESGLVVLDHAAFDLRAMVSLLVETHSLAARVKGLELTCEMDPEIPKVLVGDEGRLRQVLTNLIGNAIKFTEQGAVVLVVHLMERRPDAVCLHFSVADTGIGIPADKLSTIFDSFVQVDSSVTKQYGGTGLGLTISKRLINLLGGAIEVESTLSQGSVFNFTVPLKLPASDSDKTAKPATAGGAACRLRLLVAEDDKISQIFVMEMLAILGHEALLASTGREALERLAQGGFDAVLMDIRMPDMSGEEAARIIRQGEVPGVNPRIPIIALTAHALQKDRERFFEMGMNDYLPKPMDPEKLEALLTRLAAEKCRAMALPDACPPEGS